MKLNTEIYELLGLKKNGRLQLSVIEWWLLKHSCLHKKVLSFIESKKEIFELEDGSSVRLPPLKESISNSEKKFLDLYNALDTISEFHRNEKYFQQEMLEYHKIEHSQSDLKKWVSKNEPFGVEKYACFLIDYLDYSENAEHLSIYVHNSKELDIYIDRQDFKHTVEFLEIFNELYWVKEILPESLEKIRTRMSEIKTTANNTYK
ncbi:MAG: hypothetical protein HRT69_11635 [Flavobacteriaceae bacterium]|nr:hypothetical protein [Flavobacteriaceae bacterium]